MRYRPATVAVAIAVSIFIILAVVALYGTRGAAPATSPSPSVTVALSPTAVAVSPSPSPQPSPTATPNAPGDAMVSVTKVRVPAEFRYVVLGSGEDFRVVLLDLDAARATQVATAHVAGVRTAPAQTSAAVSASADGRVVLLSLNVPEAQSSLYVLRPEIGGSKLLLKGAPRQALVSPDGARFALARADTDPAMTGLWIGSTDDGTIKRLIADDPQFVGSPPVPFAFSPAGTLLVFGLGLGETGYQATLVPVSSAEARVDRAAAGTKIIGGDATPIGPASGAEFVGEQEAFVWSSRSAFRSASPIVDATSPAAISRRAFKSLPTPSRSALTAARWPERRRSISSPRTRSTEAHSPSPSWPRLSTATTRTWTREGVAGASPEPAFRDESSSGT